MNNPVIRKVAATFVAVLLLVYVGYQVYLNNYDGLSTETAMYSTVSETIDTTGFVVRNEEIVSGSNSGVLNYTVADGEKVSAGGIIAEVYQSESDAANTNRIARIDEELEQLSSLQNPGEYSSSNPRLIGSQINEQVVNVLDSVQSGSFSALSGEKTALQLLLSQKLIITGEESNEAFAARVEELTAERQALAQSTGIAVRAITAPTAGYFVRNTDGFENAVDPEEITTLSVADVAALEEREATASGALGKITRDYNWYIACVVTADDLVRLDRTTNVTVEMPFVSLESVPAEVVKINRDSETGSAALILRCNYMSSALASARKEALTININSYSGVLVSESAIHFEDVTVSETDDNGVERDVTYENIKGVYVKSGGRIRFVQVFSDITVNGYAICKIDLSTDERSQLVTSQTIQLYDEVVTEGRDLYDGKML